MSVAGQILQYFTLQERAQGESIPPTDARNLRIGTVTQHGCQDAGEFWGKLFEEFPLLAKQVFQFRSRTTKGIMTYIVLRVINQNSLIDSLR